MLLVYQMVVMNTNEYIFNKLSTDVQLLSLVGGSEKIVGGIANEDVELPIVSIFRLDRERIGGNSIKKHWFQVSVWSRSERE